MLSRLKEKFFAFSLVLFRLATTLFLFTFLFRILEFIILALKSILPQGAWFNLILGIAGDIAAISYFSIVLFIPFFLIFLFAEKLAEVLLRIVFTVLITLQLLLTVYFLVSGILLDDAFYNYTFPDAKYIIESTGISFTVVILGTVVVLFVIYLLQRKVSLKISGKNKSHAFFLPAAILITALHQNIMHLSINGDFGLSIQVNKSFYFFNRTTRYFSKNKNHIKPEELTQEVNFFHELHGDTNYVSSTYPLLRKNNFPDVLSPYFNKQNTVAPNLVFIIVEGLAREFTGKDAIDGSYTPFLDSLTEHSLYFPNMLSTSERTIGVLPSLLGSLPYGRGGFTKLIEERQYPHHFSLLKILKENNYFTSFHYGGWAHFTNYDDFLFEQGTDYISNEKNSAIDFSWGLSDEELYTTSLRTLDSLNISQPRVDVYLTLSTHHPFKIPRQDYYKNVFMTQLNNSKIETTRKDELKNYADNYASVLYADDALRSFFKNYSKRPEFNNTIFIITGDHAMPEIPLKARFINRYHVPLIIYSPMVKTAKTFPAVSSHLDVVPSLLSFLQMNYNITVPEKVHWLGEGLDTSLTFRNIHNVAFMYNNTEIADFISGNYFLSNSTTYDIASGLEKATAITDTKIKGELEKKLQNFRIINNYICYNDKIINAASESNFRINPEIFLPVNSSFTFGTKDTAVYILNKFLLDKKMSRLSIQYSFNYKPTATSASDLAICVELISSNGDKLNFQEQNFDLRKVTNVTNDGIPFSGFYSFDFKKQAEQKAHLRIWFCQRHSLGGEINHLSMKAKGN